MLDWGWVVVTEVAGPPICHGMVMQKRGLEWPHPYMANGDSGPGGHGLPGAMLAVLSCTLPTALSPLPRVLPNHGWSEFAGSQTGVGFPVHKSTKIWVFSAHCQNLVPTAWCLFPALTSWGTNNCVFGWEK